MEMYAVVVDGNRTVMTKDALRSAWIHSVPDILDVVTSLELGDGVRLWKMPDVIVVRLK